MDSYSQWIGLREILQEKNGKKNYIEWENLWFPASIFAETNPLMGSISGFPKSWGYPHSWMVYFMDNPTKMDDDWGYPYFRKPPYRDFYYWYDLYYHNTS